MRNRQRETRNGIDVKQSAIAVAIVKNKVTKETGFLKSWAK